MERNHPSATKRIEMDFGDADLVVTEFSDGMWALEVDDHRLLVNLDQAQCIVGAFVRLGKEKGWT